MNLSLHKLTIFTIRLLPIIYALAIILYQYLCYIEKYYELQFWLNSIYGLGVFVHLPNILLSYVYKFCNWHKIPIYYGIFVWLLFIIDEKIGICVSDTNLMHLYIFIFGITLIITIFLRIKFGDRKLNKN